MATFKLYYATNRNHVGKNRWKPESYGKKFSDDGVENLRFGRLTLSADDAEIKKHLKAKVGAAGIGDGEKLGKYLTGRAKSAAIEAYAETLEKGISEAGQPGAKFGSKAMFGDLKTDMEKCSDVLVPRTPR
jgi:hypothetical protein